MSERIEWRVVGDPGEDYGSYCYTFDDEAEARGFVVMVTQTERHLWADGPHLERRTVIETPWERADPGVEGKS